MATPQGRLAIAEGVEPPKVGSEWPKQISLPNIHTGSQQAFAFDGASIQGISWFKSEFSSWFVDDTVISDGGLYLFTVVDPLLLALPFLEAARNKTADSDGVYKSLEDLFSDVQLITAEAARALQSTTEASLSLVCDAKVAGSETYYRLNDTKVKAWLKCKMQRVVDALSAKDSQYVGMDLPTLQRYAIGLLGEYLSLKHTEALKASYNLLELDTGQPSVAHTYTDSDAKASISIQGAGKKPRVDPKEIAKLRAVEAREEKRTQQVKRETAGMKKMSAFFAPRAQKKCK